MAPVKQAPKGQKQGQGKGQKFKFKGLKLLGAVIAVYLLVFVFDQHRAILALREFAHVMGIFIPILLVIIPLTALIGLYLDPKSLARHLGEDSGARGWAIALTAGVISHGPMYAWYPTIQDLREKGAKDGLIITFFYARAVKLALLPMLAAYFGIVFAVTLTVLTLIAAWLQGLVMDRMG
jgi:uncharacterized membrane protein YraQ (UPF0718 family)